MRRSVNAAAPPVSVSLVASPPRAAPAGGDASAAVIVRPADPMLFPKASCTCTVGCGDRAAPFWAGVPGWVTITIFAAWPALAVLVNVTGGPVSCATVAVVVYGPGADPSVRG